MSIQHRLYSALVDGLAWFVARQSVRQSVSGDCRRSNIVLTANGESAVRYRVEMNETKSIKTKQPGHSSATGRSSKVPTEIRRRSEPGEAVRRNIKELATELFIRHGYNGVTFLELSKRLGINHSLIHYHFGGKERLAEEVLRDFSELGIQQNKLIWMDPDKSLFEKFVAARNRMYKRFLMFNPSGKMQHPTGLVSRFSMDAETIGPRLREIVRDTQEQLDQCVEEAVQIAISRKELVADAPVKLLMLQISSILFVAGPTARYGWEFRRLDDHFRGALMTIMRAYGTSRDLPSTWPKVRKPAKATDGSGQT